MALVLLIAGLAAFIVYDGLHDLGEKADAALVIHPPDNLGGLKNASEHAGLERAIQLYRAKDVAFILVAGSTTGFNDEPEVMADYLKSKGIPADAVIEDHHGRDLQRMTEEAAEIMKERGAQSVILVADYYNITPAKLALVHQNVVQIGKAHQGTLRWEDAVAIGGGVVDLCKFVGTAYFLPAAEKAKAEAKVGIAKATADAEQAKKDMDKKLDTMAK